MKSRMQRFNAWFDEHLQRFSDKSLELMIDMNGYHVAAVFLMMLLIGSATEPNNGVLLAIAAHYPLFTPLFWNCTFAVCAFMMVRNHEGQSEDAIAYLFFIVPVSFFFYFLLSLTLENRSQPTPYFIIMLIVACVFVIDMYVARTRVVNHFKRMVVRQKQIIDEMGRTLESLNQKLAQQKGEGNASLP